MLMKGNCFEGTEQLKERKQIIKYFDTHHTIIADRRISSFQSEPNGFADFHLYVCAAFLTRFSKDLLREKDFQVKVYEPMHMMQAEFQLFQHYHKTSIKIPKDNNVIAILVPRWKLAAKDINFTLFEYQISLLNVDTNGLIP